MVRPVGGRGVPNRGTPRPSAQEMLRMFDKMGSLADNFTGAQMSVSQTVINKSKSIITDKDATLQYYDPTFYENKAGQPASMDEYFDPTGKTPSSRQFYEVLPLTGEWRIPGHTPDEMEDSSPAPLTMVPTSTTNPKRPRTVAAGYDEDEEKLTVMFRDGTLYNYYEVDKNEWAAFKANRSKGAIIYRMLDFKPRGYADESNFTRQQLQAFYRVTRGVQIAAKGKIGGQDKTKYQTSAQYERSRRRAGKNPSKGGKAPKRK